MTKREFEIIVFRFVAQKTTLPRLDKKRNGVNPYTKLPHTAKYKKLHNLK